MTPKTLDKYISALKKKAAAGGWSMDLYQAELDKIKNEMAEQYLDDKITSEEYTKVSKQLKNAEKNPALQGKSSTSSAKTTTKSAGAMSMDQLIQLENVLVQKLNAKEITSLEYLDQMDELQALYNKKASYSEASAVVNKPQKMSEQDKSDLLHDLQSKAISKTISKGDADKLMDKVDEMFANGVTAEEAKTLLDNAVSLIKNHGFDVDDAISSAESVANQGKEQTSSGMTKDEYTELVKALEKKNAAGLITDTEWATLADKLDKAYKDGKKVSDVENEIGCDPGTLATDQAIIDLGQEFKQIYGDASKEMQTKLNDFLKEYGPEMDDLNQKVLDGTITADEYEHLKLLTIQKGVTNQKIDQLTGVMLNANQKAMGLINGEQLHVFAENANWQSYQLTQDTKMNLSFSVYDEYTAEKLIKDKPELLPSKEVNGKKDQAWNQKVIASAVAQAVIQGDSIPKLARRIATQTGETNMKAMTRYARTAMTSAQNAGRQEMLHHAAGMGIKCKKVWLATLDSRTRDAHGKLDGQAVGIDDDFQSAFGPIKFPGDMSSKGSVPANLYNCRCTLIYDYDGFPNDPTADQRISYDEYYTTEKDADGKEKKVFHRESSLITDMSYGEWKTAKAGSKLNELNAAKYQLAEAQKAVVKAGVKEDKVYEGLWKDPVTLKDYPAKKAGIQAKRDYYDTEIEKYKQAQAAGSSWATDDKIKELEKKKKLLNEFEKRGELVEKRDNALQAVQDIYNQTGYQGTAAAPDLTEAKKKAKKTSKASGVTNTSTAGQTGAGLDLSTAGEKKTPFTPDAYSQERKDNALWSTDKKYVDSIMRPHTGEVWNQATAAEKDAIVEYTTSYHKYNEPLRGIEYGTSVYKGVGNTDLNAGYANNGKRMNAMTDLIDKCSYDHDMWLQRGCGYGGMDKFFQCSQDLLQNGSQKELEQELMGSTPTEYAFASMGSAKGKGFSSHPIIMNIYAPSGTKMMYVEPFSHYGGHMYNWDGKQKQSHFGDEFETLLQQGTQFRVTKIERKGRSGTIYFDMEVINQDNQQRWDGKKKK